MKVIALKIWDEPAVAIGFLTSVGVGVLTSDPVAAIVPLASSLGLRQLVSPVRKPNG